MADNRSNIMEVALRLFAAHGYDAVGVQQIVDEAGVTKPTLYHYFQSKRGLFETLLEEKSAPLLADLEKATRYERNILQSLTQVTQLYFDFMKHQPVFYRLMLASWYMPPSSEIYQPVSDIHRRQFAMIEQMFLDAVPDHGNMRGRHKQYAVSLRGMIDTYAGLALQGYIELDDSQTVYRIVHQFMHGIFS
ncbi:MAG: helix-turn-helix domain-containing protein [Chloroflexota bacterium]